MQIWNVLFRKDILLEATLVQLEPEVANRHKQFTNSTTNSGMPYIASHEENLIPRTPECSGNQGLK